jgi:hypothetical protein
MTGDTSKFRQESSVICIQMTFACVDFHTHQCEFSRDAGEDRLYVFRITCDRDVIHVASDLDTGKFAGE